MELCIGSYEMLNTQDLLWHPFYWQVHYTLVTHRVSIWLIGRWFDVCITDLNLTSKLRLAIVVTKRINELTTRGIREESRVQTTPWWWVTVARITPTASYAEYRMNWYYAVRDSWKAVAHVVVEGKWNQNDWSATEKNSWKNYKAITAIQTTESVPSVML